MDKLEPPTLEAKEKAVRPGYTVPESVDLDIHRISSEVGQSKNEVVTQFLRWAIDAYKRGHRP